MSERDQIDQQGTTFGLAEGGGELGRIEGLVVEEG